MNFPNFQNQDGKTLQSWRKDEEGEAERTDEGRPEVAG